MGYSIGSFESYEVLDREKVLDFLRRFYHIYYSFYGWRRYCLFIDRLHSRKISLNRILWLEYCSKIHGFHVHFKSRRGNYYIETIYN